MANPVNWFMIPVKDLERAKKFYEAVIDDELARSEMGHMKMAWFPMNKGAPGAAGALVKGEGYVPSHAGTLVYLQVKDIDGYHGQDQGARREGPPLQDQNGRVWLHRPFRGYRGESGRAPIKQLVSDRKRFFFALAA